MGDYHTLSMDGSKYSYKDVDVDAKKLGFNRSQFFQYLYETYKKKRNLNDYLLLIILLGFSITIILLLLNWG